MNIATVSALNMGIQNHMPTLIPLLCVGVMGVFGCEKPVESAPQSAPGKAVDNVEALTEITPRTVRKAVIAPTKPKTPPAEQRKKIRPQWVQALSAKMPQVKVGQVVWAVIASEYDETARVATFTVSSVNATHAFITDSYGKEAGSVPGALLYPTQRDTVSVGDWVLADRPDTNLILGQVARIEDLNPWIQYGAAGARKTSLFSVVQAATSDTVPLGWVFFRNDGKGPWHQGLIVALEETKVWVSDSAGVVHVLSQKDVRPLQWPHSLPSVDTKGLCAYRGGAYEPCVVTNLVKKQNLVQVTWPKKNTSATLQLTEITTEVLP